MYKAWTCSGLGAGPQAPTPLWILKITNKDTYLEKEGRACVVLCPRSSRELQVSVSV